MKYSTRGGSIGVSLELWDNGNGVKFSVRDQGIGMSKGDQKKVFSKFSKAPADFSLSLRFSTIKEATLFPRDLNRIDLQISPPEYKQ